MNILTFDIEEWFHILDNNSTKTEKEWTNFEYRLESNVDRILELLERKNQKATFFVLGWVAREFPQVVKKIHLMDTILQPIQICINWRTNRTNLNLNKT